LPPVENPKNPKIGPPLVGNQHEKKKKKYFGLNIQFIVKM
jgi:hypothetical protein